MTIEQNIREGYKLHHGRVMEDDDYKAFLGLANLFDVPVSDYETMFEAIDFAMGLLISLHQQTGELAL